MEGGQKTQIPLNALLSADSNDMFESVNNPTLTFNRQKLQGGYLPNSVRLEMNGWASGTYGYDYAITPASPVVDTEGLIEGTVTKKSSYLCPIYTLDDKTHDISFKYYPVDKITKWIEHKPVITRLSPTSIKVEGYTTDNDISYTFYLTQSNDGQINFDYSTQWEGVDQHSGETITYDSVRHLYTFRVYDKDYNFTDSVILYKGSNLTLGSDNYIYSFRDGVHYWGEYIRIPVEQNMTTGKYKDINALSANDLVIDEYDEDNNQVHVDLTVLNPNQLTFTYWIRLRVTDILSWTTEEELTNISFSYITREHSHFEDSTVSSNNQWEYEDISEVVFDNPSVASYLYLRDYYKIVRVAFPLWAQFGIHAFTNITYCGYPQVTATAGLFGNDFSGIELELVNLAFEKSTDYSDSSKFIKRTITIPITLQNDDETELLALNGSAVDSIDEETEKVKTAMQVAPYAPKYQADGTTLNAPRDSRDYREVQEETGVQIDPFGTGQKSVVARYKKDTFTTDEWEQLVQTIKTTLLTKDKTQTRAWKAENLFRIADFASDGTTLYPANLVMSSDVALPFDRTIWSEDAIIGDYFNALHIDVHKPEKPESYTGSEKTDGVDYYLADHPEYYNGVHYLNLNITDASPEEIQQLIDQGKIVHDESSELFEWHRTIIYDVDGYLGTLTDTEKSFQVTANLYAGLSVSVVVNYTEDSDSGHTTNTTLDRSGNFDIAIGALSDWYKALGGKSSDAKTNKTYTIDTGYGGSTKSGQWQYAWGIGTYKIWHSTQKPEWGTFLYFGIPSTSITYSYPSLTFYNGELVPYSIYNNATENNITVAAATRGLYLKSVSVVDDTWHPLSPLSGEAPAKARYAAGGQLGPAATSNNFVNYSVTCTCYGNIAQTENFVFTVNEHAPNLRYLKQLIYTFYYRVGDRSDLQLDEVQDTTYYAWINENDNRRIYFTLTDTPEVGSLAVYDHPPFDPDMDMDTVQSLVYNTQKDLRAIYVNGERYNRLTATLDDDYTTKSQYIYTDTYIANEADTTPPFTTIATTPEITTTVNIKNNTPLPLPIKNYIYLRAASIQNNNYYAGVFDPSYAYDSSADYYELTANNDYVHVGQIQESDWQADKYYTQTKRLAGDAYKYSTGHTREEYLLDAGITYDTTEEKYYYDPTHGDWRDNTDVYLVDKGIVKKYTFTSPTGITKDTYAMTDSTPWTYNIVVDLYFPVIYGFIYNLYDSKQETKIDLLTMNVNQAYDGLSFSWTVNSSKNTTEHFLRAIFTDTEIDYTNVKTGTLVAGENSLGNLEYVAFAGIPLYVNDLVVVGFDYNVTQDDPLEALDLKSSGMFVAYSSSTTNPTAKALIDSYKEGTGDNLLWTTSSIAENIVSFTPHVADYYQVNQGDWSDVVQTFTLTSSDGAYFYKMTSDAYAPYFILAGNTSYATSTANATRIELGHKVGTELMTHWGVSVVDWITGGTAISEHDYFHDLPCINKSDTSGLSLAEIGKFNRVAYNKGNYIMDSYHQYVSGQKYYLRINTDTTLFTLSTEYTAGALYYVKDTDYFAFVGILRETDWQADTYYTSSESATESTDTYKYLLNLTEEEYATYRLLYVNHVYNIPIYHVDSDFNYTCLISMEERLGTQKRTHPAGFLGGWHTLLVQKDNVYTEADITSENHYTARANNYSSANSPYVEVIREGYYYANLQATYAKTADFDDNGSNNLLRNSTVTKVIGDRYTIGYNWEESTLTFKDTWKYNSSTDSLISMFYDIEIEELTPNIKISVEGIDYDSATFAIQTILNPEGLSIVNYNEDTIEFTQDDLSNDNIVYDITKLEAN